MSAVAEDAYHCLGEGEYEGVSFDDVLQRLFIATGTRNQADFAAWLGIRQSFVSDAKRRNRTPVTWLRELVLKDVKHSPAWVMSGKEPIFW